MADSPEAYQFQDLSPFVCILTFCPCLLVGRILLSSVCICHISLIFHTEHTAMQAGGLRGPGSSQIWTRTSFKIWTEHFTQSHFMKLLLMEDLRRIPKATFGWIFCLWPFLVLKKENPHEDLFDNRGWLYLDHTKVRSFLEHSCAILSSFKIVIIFNNKSAEIKTKSDDVILKMTTILKEMRVVQLCS